MKSKLNFRSPGAVLNQLRLTLKLVRALLSLSPGDHKMGTMSAQHILRPTEGGRVCHQSQ